MRRGTPAPPPGRSMSKCPLLRQRLQKGKARPQRLRRIQQPIAARQQPRRKKNPQRLLRIRPLRPTPSLRQRLPPPHKALAGRRRGARQGKQTPRKPKQLPLRRRSAAAAKAAAAHRKNPRKSDSFYITDSWLGVGNPLNSCVLEAGD